MLVYTCVHQTSHPFLLVVVERPLLVEQIGGRSVLAVPMTCNRTPIHRLEVSDHVFS